MFLDLAGSQIPHGGWGDPSLDMPLVISIHTYYHMETSGLEWAVGLLGVPLNFFSISYATHVLRHILSFKKCIVIK